MMISIISAIIMIALVVLYVVNIKEIVLNTITLVNKEGYLLYRVSQMIELICIKDNFLDIYKDETNNKKYKNRRKKMKNFFKGIATWIAKVVLKVKAVTVETGTVNGFRRLVPVTNIPGTWTLDICRSIRCPVSIELFTYVAYKISKFLKLYNFKKYMYATICNERGSINIGGKVKNKIKILDYKKVQKEEKVFESVVSKIKYAVIFKHTRILKENIYNVDVVPVKEIVDNIHNKNLTETVRLEQENWLREFYNELPSIDDINRKEVLRNIYHTSEYGIKLLVDTIGFSVNDRYTLKVTDEVTKEVSKGEMIAFAIWKASKITRSKMVPSLDMGPSNIIYFHKENRVKSILSNRKLLEHFEKLGVPQKKYQRLHKVLAPLSTLSKAKVWLGDTNALIKSDKFSEGILFMSETYAKSNKIVEGAKLAYTLKSLVHIVPDTILYIDGKQYDIALSKDEHKWKTISTECLGKIIKAFTGKTPEVNARLFKTVEIKANNMMFMELANNFTEETKKKLNLLNDICKNAEDLKNICISDDCTELKSEYEKFLFNMLAVSTFDDHANVEDDETAREKFYTLTSLGCEVLNKKYICDITYIDVDGKKKFTPSTWLIKGNGKVTINNQILAKMGKYLAKMIEKEVIGASFVGCSGTVFPMCLKPSDAYPVAWNVTSLSKLEEKKQRIILSSKLNSNEKLELLENVEEEIEYTKENILKMKKLGISIDMIYIQRHPSMLGVWTDMYYSPTTKLFYVDEQLWKTFFGGDFDGDNFVGLYPFHQKNVEFNSLSRKIVEPIDNNKICQLIYKDNMVKYLTKDIFTVINKLRREYELQPESKILKEIHKPFFKEESYANWAKAYDGKEIVGKIHSQVSNCLSFFNKTLKVMDKLEFNTYFILKYIQPAIEGLKHEDEGFIPKTADLIKEMKWIYEKMFHKNISLPSIEDIEKHKKVYTKIRSFETIGLKSKVKDSYISKDLYYKKEDYLEVSQDIDTYWTRLYKKIIKIAETYIYSGDNTTTDSAIKDTKPKMVLVSEVKK